MIASVSDGERTIITRHGEPQAVLLGLRDAIELLAAARLVELADRALNDLAAGAVAEPWAESRTAFRMLLARAAEASFARARARDRFLLRQRLCRGEADAERPLWLRSGRRLVGFSYPMPGVALVHDLMDARELERELLGETLWRARVRRARDRRLHGRD